MNRSRACGRIGTSMTNRSDAVILYVIRLAMKRIKYSLKFAFILIAILCIPSWWIGTTIQTHGFETRAQKELQKIAPDSLFERQFCGPVWLGRIGFRPEWMNRVWRVDLTGLIHQVEGPGDLPVNFTDADFSSSFVHLKKFKQLEELYLGGTLISDESSRNLEQTLSSLRNIRFVNLQETQLTSETVKMLEKQHPNVKMPYWHKIGPQKW